MAQPMELATTMSFTLFGFRFRFRGGQSHLPRCDYLRHQGVQVARRVGAVVAVCPSSPPPVLLVPRRALALAVAIVGQHCLPERRRLWVSLLLVPFFEVLDYPAHDGGASSWSRSLGR